MSYQIKLVLTFYLVGTAFSQIDDDSFVFPDSIELLNQNKKQPSQIISSKQSLLPEDCGNFYSGPISRISGGTKTKLGEFPWMVLLQFRESVKKIHLNCAGSLINSRYVLTAAHCVNRTGEGAKWTLEAVRLGEYNFETQKDCGIDVYGNEKCAYPVVYMPIEEEIVHEQYIPNQSNQHNDIALLRLAHDIVFTEYIRPICLPSSRIDNNFIVAGWGQTGSIERQSEVLRKVNLNLHDHASCKSIYGDPGTTNPTVIIDSQLCAVNDGEKDTCRGDSGSPLMQLNTWSGRFPRWEVVGITSYGYALCGINKPSIYTQVNYYKSWILSKLRP